MNKKLLLFSLGAIAASVQHSHADFHIGAYCGGNLHQMKIYDGSQHQGTVVSYTFPAGATYAGRAIDGTYSVPVPDMFRSSGEVAVTPDYQFGVRPEVAIYAGYDYRFNAFILGVEISAGAKFGSSKCATYAKTPELKHLAVTDGDPCSVYEKTATPVTDILLYNVEVKTKFVGEASIRAGYLIPGTDGRLAFVLFGGIGLANREISAELVGSKEFYSSAIFDGFYRNAEALVYNNPKGGSADQIKAHYAYMAMSDPVYYAYKLSGIGLLAKTYTVAGADVNAAALDAASQIITDVLVDGKSGTKLLVWGLDSDLSGKKSGTKFTWHVGANLEYTFSNGAFVRVGYKFRYIKGLNVEQSYTVTSPSKEAFVAAFKKEIKDGGLDDLVMNSTFTNGNATSDAIKTALTQTLLEDALTHEFAGLAPGKFSLGNIDYKVGTGEKSCEHTAYIGFGWKLYH
ncbi:MAG: hypothetical protein LBF84_00330 [Holosporales bacterium]|jgi:opacity protein-like surface antigen|nr:hypothetical protein [Holosporales bacterium]